MCPMRNDVTEHNSASAAREDNHPEPDGEGKEDADATNLLKTTSMGTLIIWNIKKALEADPKLDLKGAIQDAQASLESSEDLSSVLSQTTSKRHMACAVLAWQQLDHAHTDSLHRFITKRLEEQKTKQRESFDICQNKFGSDNACSASNNLVIQNPSLSGSEVRATRAMIGSCSASKNCFAQNPSLSGSEKARAMGPGPVLRVPMLEPKVVMRLDAKSPCQPRKPKDVKKEIESVCCMDSCTERLQAVDKTTQELRARAACLARREATRVELLERAEAAWRDLEAGYQRRLRLAHEKEEQIERQMVKLIKERNEFKNTCTALIAQLTARTDAAEKQREDLVALENEVCKLACERVKLAEQAARGDAMLADELCKTAHLDRELMFKEEQARRRQMALEGDADAAAALTHEAERALHAELGALKAQMEQASAELLQEDAETNNLKQRLQDLREERNGLTEDLESCTARCDGRMQGMVDELKQKREELAALKLKEMDCHCKLPVDVSVEVKRTPSVAALCQCTPEDKFMGACSCTSLRSSLMSTLLGDLFTGLQSELNIQDTQLPCQLLKCLEDKHNWDRASAIKTRLRDFFSQLLLGELDIAIATAIENYHVKWVGESCADTLARLVRSRENLHSKGWQERALEKKAQEMASELAEQLFKDKAKELAQQATDILAETGRPPCECHPDTCCPSPKGMYPCLVDPPTITVSKTRDFDSLPNNKVLYQTHHEVSHLKKEIEQLKKEIIKREDLNMMEDKIAKMVQLASGSSPVLSILDTISVSEGYAKNEYKNCKITNNDQLFRNNRATNKSLKPSKLDTRKRQTGNITSPIKSHRTGFNQNETNTVNKSFKRTGQQFAVNMCLLDATNELSAESRAIQKLKNTSTPSCKQSSSRDNVSIKQVRPIKSVYTEMSNIDDIKNTQKCETDCICFHKKPSNSSIDKLLETLTKWKLDLEDSPVKLSRGVDKNEDTKSLVKTSQKCSSYTGVHCEPLLMNSHETVESLEKTDSKVIILTHKSSNQLQEIKSAVVSNSYQITKCIDSKNNTNLPIPTESEFMGAINLDKSAEYCCKHVNGNDKKSKIKFPFKCINSAECTCKDCATVPIHHERGVDTQSFLSSKLFKIENNPSHNRTEDPYIPKIQNIKMDETAIDSVKDVYQRPGSHDNQIKCLGVTLTNIRSPKKPIEKPIKDIENLSKVHNVLLGSQKDLNNGITPPRGKKRKQQKYERKLYKDLPNRESVLGTSVNEHQMEDKEFKKEKKLNDIDDACICCKNYNADDLEENTFQLLEEHLKGKLEEIKNSFSIPNVEEEKIFTGILRRIKQLISETTSSVACKCISKNEVNGSWNRAYCLLQEYLKVKIDRVKCQCESDKIGTRSEMVLPNILKNISNLIENDFQRLKEMCKCKSVYQAKNEKNNSEIKPILHLQTKKLKREPILKSGQKPTTNKQSDWERIHSNNSSENLGICTSDTSAQVSFNRAMETKSCDAMKKKCHYTEVQTIDDLRKILTIDGYNNARSSFGSCVVKKSEKDMKRLPDVSDVLMACEYRKSDLNINDNNSENHKPSGISRFIDRQPDDDRDDPGMKETSPKPALSYIGYTMDCNCDEDLGCVCTKSTVRDLHDRQKIKDIWKKNTNKKVAFPDISYILESRVPEKNVRNVNRVEIRGGSGTSSTQVMKSTNLFENNVCDTEINATYEKDISLKKSKEIINFSHARCMTNSAIHYKKSVSDNKMGCSFIKSRAVCTPSRNKSEYFGAVKPKVDALYSSEHHLYGHINNNLDSKNALISCHCKMVPICHVKMLVQNIEEKLNNYECICDSMSPKVCPVHTRIKH